ncbi:GNAT family N-acetyltransferase [Winogradskyella sediminis]|uniref:GNAT family N-acetyltransferase n=1 Tax=Winogradskyella sediminis TaxID=1382466 RepID=UPI000E265A18|nr:GNAT family N-acetyltransferase [Winogradskyella sediminis]REG88101.1 acetyltransferase (GNAT) family protein [Winogradskyella sediminis]
MGTCGLYHREDREDPDIGFAFLPNFIGKGYAFEAAQRLMVAAKESYGLSDLSAYTLNTNLGSKKLLEGLGFSVNGLSRLPNNEEELLHYFCTLTEVL